MDIEDLDRDGFVGLRTDWQRLSASAGTPFHSWSWAAAWREVYGRRSKPVVLAVRHGSSLRGLAPWARVRVGPLPMLVGMGQEVADFGGFLVDDDDAEVSAELLFDALLERAGPGAIVSFGRVDPETHLDGLIRRAVDSSGRELVEVSPEPYPWFDLSTPDAASRVDRLVKKNDVRRRLRRLRDAHEVEFVRTSDDPVTGLRTFIDLHDRRWEQKAGTPGGTFVTTRGRVFWDRLVRADQEERPVISMLLADGQPIASRIGFLHRGVYYGAKSAFDPDYASFGPGHVMVGELLRTGVEEGWSRFEFMRGEGSHKHAWTDASRSLPYLMLAPRLPGGAGARIARAALGARYRVTYA